MFRSAGADKLLDKATSNLNLEPDWQSILQICDLIRQNDIQPKTVLQSLKKRLNSPNQHTAMFSVLVLESLVKNCGSTVHDEVTSRAFCDTLHDLVKTTAHEEVRKKLLELIQTWSEAFRKNPKYSALKETMNAMKSEGFKFPQLRESDVMFSAETAPEWAEGNICHRCRTQVGTITSRRHHCRACGQVFCGQCSSKTSILPRFGIEKEVRVCDVCYEQTLKMSTPSASSNEPAVFRDMPMSQEYLSSEHSQQRKSPTRKNSDELKEQEDLELAMAISQSEAEAREKAKQNSTFSSTNNYSSLTNIDRSPSNKINKDDNIRNNTSPPPTAASSIGHTEESAELARYLNRPYWTYLSKLTDPSDDDASTIINPSAPLNSNTPSSCGSVKMSLGGVSSAGGAGTGNAANNLMGPPSPGHYLTNGLMETTVNHELEEFIGTLRSQVEIFINRMKSNSSRGRNITNDSSVQTLFMNITAMHSKLLQYIQEHDDRRLHFEQLQDKLVQVKDARAALDDLREEHRMKLRMEAEEADRQRRLQMAQKLETMRKKKQEYLQYQREITLQRVQEQEREFQMRQEQQKQQYKMAGGIPPNATPTMLTQHSIGTFVPAMYGSQSIATMPVMGHGQHVMVPPQMGPSQQPPPGSLSSPMVAGYHNPASHNQQPPRQPQHAPNMTTLPTTAPPAAFMVAAPGMMQPPRMGGGVPYGVPIMMPPPQPEATNAAGVPQPSAIIHPSAQRTMVMDSGTGVIQNMQNQPPPPHSDGGRNNAESKTETAELISFD